MNKRVIVIGGGIAGMEASAILGQLEIEVLLIEKKEQLGGHVAQWEHLFPNFRPANEVSRLMVHSLRNKLIKICTKTEVKSISKESGRFSVKTSLDQNFKADAILLTTGYDLFDAKLKEEYGYGIYDNVITSADLEQKFKQGGAILTAAGKIPKRIAIIHCVGSRDEKTSNFHCSRVCCITAIKQAIELRQNLPNAEIFCFYMDLRMFGKGFEELYRESQEKWGIQFIRGRLSEAGENHDGSLQIKSEDTLSGRPLKMNVDLMILMVGMVPSSSSKLMAGMLGVHFSADGFVHHEDEHLGSNITNQAGIFTAGTVSGPMSITDTVNDARSAALKIVQYINN